MDIYTKIKRQNGEAFAKAIRNYDNGIFDIPGIVDMLKYAGRDAEVLMNYLVSLKNIHIQEQEVPEDPIELLDKAGYDAYVVTALTDDENPNFDPNNPKTWVGQNTIQCYYAPGEELCTFRDPHRFEDYFIINAVDPNVKKIKRGNPPKREDEYGTSVISIQVLKEGTFISIKNRYNHTVSNPDNTFGSNPDNIILGLSEAIRHRFGVDFSSQKVSLPEGFIRIRDQEGKDRIVRYHTEKEGYYFGPSCYVKDGVITKVGGHEILLEGLVLNLKAGTVTDVAGTDDTLRELLENAISGKKIQITKDKDGVQHLLADDQEVLTMKDGRLLSMNIPSGVTEIGYRAFCECTNLTSIDIPNSVTEIECGAFLGCTNLTSIKIPGSVTKIEYQSFWGCSSLTSINIPSGVTTIGNEAFFGCSSLTSINIPDGVTKIGQFAFSGCTSLTSVVIPSGVTKIGWRAFEGCTNLTFVNIPDGVTEIEDEAFGGCSGLTSISIPESVTEIGAGAFLGCTALTSINIPDGVTEIGKGAFNGCLSLTSVHIPQSVHEIGELAFRFCSALTSVHIPDGVTEIGVQAFMGCHLLTSVHIPESVRKIEMGAFGGCSSLQSITLPNGVTEIGAGAFERCEKLSITCATKEQEAMIRKSGFEGPIKIAPKTLSQQANIVWTSSPEEKASAQFKGDVPQKAPKQLTLAQLKTLAKRLLGFPRR